MAWNTAGDRTYSRRRCRHSKAVEFAEDDPEKGWNDLQQHDICPDDVVIGIAASGTTPYVVGALERCKQNQILTIAIACKPRNTWVAKAAHYPIEIIVGPEVVTGSTRMKAGTAQKLVLNMISTSVMVQPAAYRETRWSTCNSPTS